MNMKDRKTFLLRASMAVFSMLYSSGVASGFDGNGNGVSDVWEAKYGLVDPSKGQDLDHDGHSDWSEAVHGTNPRDSESRFSLSFERHDDEAWFVTWQGKFGMQYVLQGLGEGGGWEDLGEFVAGNDSIVGYADRTGSATTVAYRVLADGERQVAEGFRETLAAMDTDGDGQDDWTEWTAGTSIIDPAERFEIDQIRRVETTAFRWWGVAGMEYSFEKFEDGNWKRIGGSFAGNDAPIVFTMESTGQSGMFRVVENEPDSDRDGLADWEERMAGLDPAQKHSRDAVRTDLEVVSQELWSGGTVSLEVGNPVVATTAEKEGSMKLVRKGGFAPISVPLNTFGDAVPGEDYEVLPKIVDFPFGVNEVILPVRLSSETSLDSSKSVGVEIGESDEFEAGEVTRRSVTLLKEHLINVKDHGALGDGNADDGPAIQNAIDALQASTEYNGLYFPSGTYRMAHAILDPTVPMGSYRMLKMGRDVDLAGRDIVFSGDAGATLYSDLGSIRANMLLCTASFRSFTIRNLRFKQASDPLWAKPGSEPNGSDGVTVVRKDTRHVEEIRFVDCEFINCHRSVSIYGRGYDVRGLCGVLSFENCQLLNPYGANTVDSQTAWGGGQQVYVTPWVAEARYESCLFEGGGEDMTDTTTSPGGRLKDGGHFGSPLQLIFCNNTVRRMGVEALYQINDNTFMGGTKSEFTIPDADNTTEVTLAVNSVPSTYIPGETIVIRTPLTPGSTPSNTHFTIREFNPESRILTLTNPGTQGNLPPGTVVPSGRVIYLDERSDPSRATIVNNVFEGDVPPAGLAFIGRSGIVFAARSTVEGNLVKGFRIGIYNRGEVHTPIYPAANGSQISNNLVITGDSRVDDRVYTYGVYVWQSDQIIRNNLIYVPISRKTVGIVLRGDGTMVVGNTAVAIEAGQNGYESSVRSVGVGMGNTSKNTRVTGNWTCRFDVGVGPEKPYQTPPYFLDSHFSVQDVLAVDERGIIEE